MKRTVGEAWTAFKLNRWPRLRHTTQTLYELTWRVHVAPKWQYTALRAIGTEAVESWQAEMLAESAGKRTVQAAVQLFGQMFKVAERYRWVDYSPVSIATTVHSKTHVLALTPAQIARLIVEADPDTMLLVQFAAPTR